MHGACMVCELGVVTVTLLELVSGTNPNEASTDKNKQLGATLASLAATCVTFCLTVVGAGSALSSVKVVVNRISAVPVLSTRSPEYL